MQPTDFGAQFQFGDKGVVAYTHFGEILGMGGPWVGNVQVNGVPLPGQYGEPPRYDEGHGLLVLPRYRRNDLSSRFDKGYFTFTVLDLATWQLYERLDRYSLMHISETREGWITIHEANHSGVAGGRVRFPEGFVVREVLGRD